MKYGVDITSTRLDDLDKRLLSLINSEIQLGTIPKVLDVGGGAGGLAVALALMGAKVTTVDIADYKTEVENNLVSAGLGRDVIQVIKGDIAKAGKELADKYDVVVIQRTLHYLPYDLAKKVLTDMRLKSERLFLSVTGVNTEIAKYYSEINSPIESRWGVLSPVGQQLFSIAAPLCLYSEEEIKTLLSDTGWLVEWSRVSDFGNIKIKASGVQN